MLHTLKHPLPRTLQHTATVNCIPFSERGIDWLRSHRAKREELSTCFVRNRKLNKAPSDKQPKPKSPAKPRKLVEKALAGIDPALAALLRAAM